jgi:hypothetical protein
MHPRLRVQDLPEIDGQPAVYALCSDSTGIPGRPGELGHGRQHVLYVGRSRTVLRRLRTHDEEKPGWTFAYVRHLPAESYPAVESHIIRSLCPQLNIQVGPGSARLRDRRPRPVPIYRMFELLDRIGHPHRQACFYVTRRTFLRKDVQRYLMARYGAYGHSGPGLVSQLLWGSP